jgi:DNA-binding transcriptional regulator GbsR (MarR family)
LAGAAERDQTRLAHSVLSDEPGRPSARHRDPEGATGQDAGMQDSAQNQDPEGAAGQGAEPAADAQGDPVAIARFIERFASVLVEAGIPRMPARVFSALLATDSGRLTAAELSEQLKASAAAVSGGVRYLIGVGMVSREGEPGSRRHHYRVPDHVWDEVITGRDRLMARWTAVLREGVALVGPDTPAGARLADSVQYFEFVSAELPRVLARWQEHKAALERAAERDGNASA